MKYFNYKKALLLISLFVCFIANASTDSGVYEATEYGEVVYLIELNKNGTATLKDLRNKNTMHTTYNIEGNIQPGESCIIEFYHNGRTYRGRWMWAIEDGKAISLDGMFFKRVGYSRYNR